MPDKADLTLMAHIEETNTFCSFFTIQEGSDQISVWKQHFSGCRSNQVKGPMLSKEIWLPTVVNAVDQPFNSKSKVKPDWCFQVSVVSEQRVLHSSFNIHWGGNCCSLPENSFKWRYFWIMTIINNKYNPHHYNLFDLYPQLIKVDLEPKIDTFLNELPPATDSIVSTNHCVLQLKYTQSLRN